MPALADAVDEQAERVNDGKGDDPCNGDGGERRVGFLGQADDVPAENKAEAHGTSIAEKDASLITQGMAHIIEQEAGYCADHDENFVRGGGEFGNDAGDDQPCEHDE